MTVHLFASLIELQYWVLVLVLGLYSKCEVGRRYSIYTLCPKKRENVGGSEQNRSL